MDAPEGVGWQTGEHGLEVFDAAPVGVAVTSGPGHTLIYANEVYRSIFGDRPYGVPAGEVVGTADEPDQRFWELTHVVETGETLMMPEVPIIVDSAGDARQQERWFNVTLSPISAGPGRRGREPGVAAVLLEVTDQVRAGRRAEALSEERRRMSARYRTLGVVGTQFVWVTSADGRVIEPSDGWESVTGETYEEFRGEAWMDFIHPADLEPTMASWNRAVAEVPPVWEWVYRMRTASGEYRHFKTRAVPVFDEGQLVEWVGTNTDIEEEIHAERRRELLERAAVETSGMVRLDEILDTLGHIIVPELADACRVYVLPEGANRPGDEYVTIEHVSSVISSGLPRIAGPRLSRRGPDTTLAQAVRERRPIYRIFPPGRPPPDITTDEVRDWFVANQANSLVCVPISVEGTVAAVVAVSVTGDRPPVTAEEVGLMGELFDHAHDALSSAVEFRKTQQIALALQHSLLTEPPRVPGLSIAARYQPSSTTAEVGGDWYDCFVHPDGSTVLTIGDVAGHDLPAAVTMGQIRTILRGLAVDRQGSAADILRRLNSAIEALYVDSMATCILAKIEQAAGGRRLLNYAVAGHPPPLLVTPDGRCRFLTAGNNPVLGMPSDQAFDYAEEPLTTGCTLLLYTDGLIEQPDEDLDTGLDRLCTEAGLLATAPVEDFCDHLLERLPTTGDDDVALIALRLP